MRTVAGRNWLALVMGDGTGAEGTGTPGSGDYAPADYIGLSANTDPEDPDNTTLPGEINAGTLVRAQATFAFTPGAASYTLTKQFTSDQTVTLAKAGVFNAATDGTLVFEKLLANEAPLISGDKTQITVTVEI